MPVVKGVAIVLLAVLVAFGLTTGCERASDLPEGPAQEVQPQPLIPVKVLEAQPGPGDPIPEGDLISDDEAADDEAARAK